MWKITANNWKTNIYLRLRVLSVCVYHLKAKQQKKAAESQRNVYFSRSYLNITYLIEKKDTNNTQWHTAYGKKQIQFEIRMVLFVWLTQPTRFSFFSCHERWLPKRQLTRFINLVEFWEMTSTLDVGYK